MIKKRFLILGAIGAIFATNVYADSNKSVVAVYTCQDGCNVTNDAGKTNFSCTNPNGKACGDVIANVFIPQTSDTIVNIAQKTQTKSEPVSGRAGKITSVTTIPAISSASSSPCPKGCFMDCSGLGTPIGNVGGMGLSAAGCHCVDGNGNRCKETER